MRRTRIYTNQRLAANSQVLLDPGASAHLARVLRLQEGDALTLFDGSGGEYPAVICALTRKQVSVTTGEHLAAERESGLHIHLGIAMSRGDRMDWVMQKATELGVAAVTPLFTERTEVKLSAERAAKKLRHWQQVMISACEQCGRNRLPQIRDMQRLAAWLADTNAQRKFVLHHRAKDRELRTGKPSSVALLVGPEGGLTEAEIESAGHAGYSALRLGPRVLRTETAPLAGIAILQARWGDMTG